MLLTGTEVFILILSISPFAFVPPCTVAINRGKHLGSLKVAARPYCSIYHGASHLREKEGREWAWRAAGSLFPTLVQVRGLVPKLHESTPGRPSVR